jgi:hypothetical protein
VHYITNVLHDLKQSDKVSEEDKKKLEPKIVELSVRQQAKGCVMMARQLALEWELSGGELEKALAKARNGDEHPVTPFLPKEGPTGIEGLEIDLGNRPRL